MKFAVYSRKSVYSAQGDSVDNQVIECKKRILSLFPDTDESDIIAYIDEGFSGKNLERPKFKKMMSDVRERKIQSVVCYRLDRISRSVSDFSKLIDELKSLGVAFISVNEDFNTNTPGGRAMVYMVSIFAQLERETIAERVRDNMHALARKGQWLGGTPPLGFRSERIEKITVDDKVKTACLLKISEAEIDTVTTIFEKFLELGSINGVSKYLISQSIHTRSGKMFSLLGVKEILQNPVYCAADKLAFEFFRELGADVCFGEEDCNGTYGLLAYNKRDHNKRNIPRNTVDKWIIAIGKHKGVISGEDWVSVQKTLAKNTSGGETSAVMHNDYALLSGMIRCEKCKARMFAKNRYKKNNPGLFDYVCSNKIRGSVKLCGSENIGGREADEIICDYLTQNLNENSEIYKYLDKLKKEISIKKRENPLDSIDKSIKKLSTEKENLIRALAEGFDDGMIKQIKKKSREIEDELKVLEARRESIANSLVGIAGGELQIDLITEALADLRTNFETLTIHEKRNIIRLLVKEITWDGENFNIFIYSGQ